MYGCGQVYERHVSMYKREQTVPRPARAQTTTAAGSHYSNSPKGDLFHELVRICKPEWDSRCTAPHLSQTECVILDFQKHFNIVCSFFFEGQIRRLDPTLAVITMIQNMRDNNW